LVRQSGLSSIFALAAVGSGLVLDASIASRFGAGRTSDAFYVALRVPVGMGVVAMSAATQALVPTFSVWLVDKGQREGTRLASALFTAVLLGGALLAGVLAALAWPLMRLTAPGMTAHQVNMAASVARVLFLMVPLICAAEVLRALLNSHYVFSAPAGMNVVMNGTAAALVLGLRSNQVSSIAWAYVAGAAMQLLFMAGVTIRSGVRYRPTLPTRGDAELRRAGRNSVRPIAAGSLNPLARVGEQLLVSFLPPGSITLLTYGNRLISAIGGPGFRSVVVTLLPRLSRAHARHDDEEIGDLTRAGMRIALAVAVPLTVLVAVLGEPAARIAFRRGNFSRADTDLLGLLLAFYAISLVGSGVQRVFLAPFFARLDTSTPLRNTVYGVVANLVLIPSLLLLLPWTGERQVLTVAVAYSVAQYVNVGHGWYRLSTAVGVRMRGVGFYLFNLVVAAGAGAVTMMVSARALHLSGPLDRIELLWRTGVVAAAGLVVLVGIITALPGWDVRQTWKDLRRSRPAVTT
jgi:murein biosynthesis integral membrane protein MurJ